MECPPFNIERMRTSDVDGVFELQCAVHETRYHEPKLSFLKRILRFPEGCLVARDGSGGIYGYSIAYPYPRSLALATPPSLASNDSEEYDVYTSARVSQAAADFPCALWWIHDVAVRTSGMGVGGALTHAQLTSGRELGLSAAACVTVSEGGRALHSKFGFEVLRALPEGAYAIRDSLSIGASGGAAEQPEPRGDSELLMVCEFKPVSCS